MDYISLSREADKKLELGKEEEAKTLLEKGLSLAKRYRNKYFTEFFLGELQNIDGNYELSISHHKNAVKLARKKEFKAFFLQNLGVTLSLLGRHEEAIELYDKALEIRPNDYDSLRNKGVSLSKLGREEEAIEFYDKALEIKPDDYNSLRQKGVSLSELGRMEEAIEFYDKALEIKPDDWLSLVSKAFTLEDVGNNEEAAKIFDYIASNEDKVKNEEIVKVVNFKRNALKEKEKDKKQTF